MSIRDRIVELCRVRAGDLRRNPQNWRTHPERQRAAMRSVLHEIGYADALLARRRTDGALELIDGHLRAETTPDLVVPVLVVDLDDREAGLLLAVHDPLTAMAEADDSMLRTLLDGVARGRAEVEALLHEIVGAVAEPPPPDRSASTATWNDLFQVVVECGDESQQRTVYERLTAEGFRCRVLTL